MVTLEEAADIIEGYGYERTEDTNAFHGTGVNDGETVYLTEKCGIIEVCWNNEDPDSHCVTRVDVNEVMPQDFSDTFFYIWNYPNPHDVEHHDIANIVKSYGMYVMGKQETEDGKTTLCVCDASSVSGVSLHLDYNGNVEHILGASKESDDLVRRSRCASTYVWELVKNKAPIANAVKSAMIEHENVTVESLEGPFARRFCFKSAMTGKSIYVYEDIKKVIVKHDVDSFEMFTSVPPFFVKDILKDRVYGYE